MSEAISALKGASHTGFATVAEAGLTGMISIRADLTSKALAKALKGLGLSTPDQRKVVTAEGHNANGQRNTQGRVTSTYYSPMLKRGIAMGLVLNGPDRMGEVLEFPGDKGAVFKAKIVDPVFYDRDGEKQNV